MFGMFLTLASLLPACRTVPTSTPVRPPDSSPPPSALSGRPIVAPAGPAPTRPPDNERERALTEAMRGLLYDSGFAQRDPILAPLVVPVPDPQQAPAKEQAARASLTAGAVL